MFVFSKNNTRSIIILGWILLFVFSLFRFTYFNIDKVDSVSSHFEVIEKAQKYVILRQNNNKYIYYDSSLQEGNIIEINGTVELLDNSNDFNKYLHSQRVFYLIKGNVENNNGNKSVRMIIIDKLLKNKDEDNKKFLKLILFNIKENEGLELYKYFNEFSITFLLVISGFHINLLFKVLKKRKISKYVVITLYLYLLNFSVSAFRAFLYKIIKKIVKNKDLTFNNIDILSLIMMSFIFVNPSYCFSLGFIYSFLFSFALEMINNVYINNNLKDKMIKKIIVYLVSIPLILFNYYELNILSFLALLIFELPISILFIFSFIYLFLDKFYLIYKFYIHFASLIIHILDRLSFDIIFGKPSIIIIILLYMMIVLLLYSYQNRDYWKSRIFLISYLLILFLQYNLPNLDSREIVYFLDVGQGDCSILKIRNSKKVVIIDTGGSKYRDIAKEVIIPFLKSKGIREIECIIISHDDFDHNGAKDSIMENFRVNNVIENSNIKQVEIGDSIFYNLNINDNRDNDGSIVLYGEYGDLKYLFMGDVSSDIEKDILTYSNLTSDVIKLSHHGSNTASSELFLKSVNPKVALIGVGKGNNYGHPSEIVLNRLHRLGIKVYRTDKDGNVMIYKSLISEEIIIENE